METNKRYLVHFTFSESFKSTSNSLQNFKSLRVRVLEITGGLSHPPPPPVLGVGTKHLSMGRVNLLAVLYFSCFPSGTKFEKEWKNLSSRFQLLIGKRDSRAYFHCFCFMHYKSVNRQFFR